MRFAGATHSWWMHELSKIGAMGEQLAWQHSQSLGFELLDRNFRSRRGEIDLIVTKNKVVSFIEVKTRRSGSAGHPFEAITKAKMAAMRGTAVEWLASRQVNALAVNFGAVAVRLSSAVGEAPFIEFLEEIG